jgi:hypothetical protein
MDALRSEVEIPHNIRVTNILPGSVATNISRNALTKDGSKRGKSDENIDKLLVYCNISDFEYYNYSKINCKKYLYFPIKNNFKSNPLIHYEEGQENPDKKILNHLTLFDSIATPYHFGKNILDNYKYSAQIIKPLINNEIYHKKYDKLSIRKAFGIKEDSFLGLIICKNNDIYDSKSISENIEAFGNFSINNSEAELYIHTNMNGIINILELIKKHNLENKVYYTDIKDYEKGLSEETMCKLYCMADVYLNCSKSEKLGLCNLESQLCETPIITTDITCFDEINFKGIKTETIEKNKQQGVSFWCLPLINNIVNGLIQIKAKIYPSKNINQDFYNKINYYKKWEQFLEISI